MEKRALDSGRSLPRTTLSEVLNGKRFPTRAFLLTFVELCGVPPEQQGAWRQAWNRLSVQYRVDLRQNAAPVADRLNEAQLRLREAETLAEHLQDELSRLRTRAGEPPAELVPVWRQVAGALADQGRWELAERALRSVIELCRRLSGDGSPAGLTLRYELALITARQDDGRASELLHELLADCRGALAATDPLIAAVRDALARHAPENEPEEAEPEPDRGSGTLPTVWNVEPRNPEFTGRQAVITDMRRRLRSGGSAVVQVLRGWGGIGKTQIAIEYAHRFSDGYQIVWWIDAEDPVLIGKQLAELAEQLRLVDHGADTASAVALLKAHLRGRDGWLLLFDNAEDPALIRKWLPGGPGHVVITSRTGGWEHLAATIHINVMKRPESVDLLRSHGPGLDLREADELANALGDLPLALVQASVFLAETVTDLHDYLRLLRSRPREVLSEGNAGDYPLPLAAAIGLTMDRLAQLDPIGLALAQLCAFLAPETIPVEWLVGDHPVVSGPHDPPAALATGDAIALRRGVASMGRFGLAINARGGIRLHRLTQSVIRDRLSPEAQRQLRDHARALLVGNQPGDPEDPDNWPRWARMVPHLLALDPAVEAEPELRETACNAGWYLIERGDVDAAVRLSAELYDNWRDTLGPGHRHTLTAARDLARALRERGEYDQAARLYEDALARAGEALGADDPLTLRIEHGFAIDLHLLGRYAEAYDLQHDALTRYRRVLGVDHPHTLHSANHLAVALHALGQFDQARALHEETLARYRDVLGDDHPDTLRSANNLAVDLRSLSDHERARALQTDTLARRRRTLGEDHPHTLQSATSLSETLHGMGRPQEALPLQEETLGRYLHVLGGNHPETLRARANLIDMLLALGRDEDAERLRADITVKQTRHPEHP
ncbi:FxSxx-COOH system tetratricopeptide repeat protein [Streptosporangium amethystogenes]|uniref:FxSxx-COOH system tetratricopeptide repeat protein n=1 Tax=Streptosporangium amethystogenes TaxID=2002 RepID=UPI00379F68E8